MTHQIFSEYSLLGKVKLIRRCGTHVATRHHNRYHIELYALDKIMVEVWYTRRWFRKKAIKVKSGFVSDDFLEPYFNMIQLKIDAKV